MTEVLAYEMIELFEDLEKNRPCSPAAVNSCSNKATCIAIQICCGVEIPLCTQHKNESIEWLTRMVELGNSVRCTFCGTTWEDPMTAIDWVDIK